MYKDELELIWKQQAQFFEHLPDDFMQKDNGVLAIIFYQRPLKLRKDRVGKCSLEPNKNRANTARLEVQKFRYLQDVNDLKFFDNYTEQLLKLDDIKREKLITYFEHNPKITIKGLQKLLGLDNSTKINLEDKNLKGNITACEIRKIINDTWDNYSAKQQSDLFEDLFTIKKKSALKARLITHWDFDKQTAVKLCLIEFEPSHSSHSLKAINKLLPYLEQGMIYPDARIKAGYDYEIKATDVVATLGIPPKTANPIVNKGMHEIRRLVNAIIKQHGKPDIIRIEMARDLEMNTTRYKENEKRQNQNKKANENARKKFEKYNPRQKAKKNDILRYKLWQEQSECCIYSGYHIGITELWSDELEIDHIVPRSLCLDDSYTNKVICFIKDNRKKSQQTPIDAWNPSKKWDLIVKRIENKKYPKNKCKQFYIHKENISEKYGMSSSQLNDTRYISTLAQKYVQQLGCDVNVTKGAIVAEVRRQWGMNSIVGIGNKKDRTDHRHHTIDAVVIACMNRSLHTLMVKAIKHSEATNTHLHLDTPYPAFRNDVKHKIDKVVISHVPQRKLTGALHKDTGYGYIKNKWLVTRQILDKKFTKSNAETIIDSTVREKVINHIELYGNNAFSEENKFKLKIGKNSIKKVRILKPRTKFKNPVTIKELKVTKFNVNDKQGNTFKYMDFGNNHHVEIIKNINTGKFKGEFVTMMLASHRAKGINIPKQAIVKTDHGQDWEFVMALHINDTVSIEQENGNKEYYRVQKLSTGSNRFMLRLAKTSTLDNKEEGLNITINKNNFDKYNIKLHNINAIGKNIDND
jgi:CRISPR-associated endonuclease Csn1